MGTLTTRWRKSSYSGGNGGACIEIATRRHDGHILVRDSKTAPAALCGSARTPGAGSPRSSSAAR
jgi:hypothetical protein